MLQILKKSPARAPSRGSLEPAQPAKDSTAAMTDAPLEPTVAERVAAATPEAIARRVRGLSDRVIAWLFIAPTIVLLLAINVFPLIWTIGLSFTNFRANRPNAPVKNVGLDNYHSIL